MMQELDHKQEGFPGIPHVEMAQSPLHLPIKNNLKDDQPAIQGHGNTISSRPRSNYEEINNAPR